MFKFYDKINSLKVQKASWSLILSFLNFDEKFD